MTDPTLPTRGLIGKRWWKYGVLRGDGIPARLDGRWYDLDDMPEYAPLDDQPGAVVEATNRWEQRDDGEVAVVYEWRPR